MNHQDIWKFIFELGQLRRIRHEGWRLIGIDDPESVAEHSLRAAQVGYLLAHLEGYERPEEVAAIGIFHDLEECRIGDLHRIASRYVEADKERAAREQTAALGAAGEHVFRLWLQDERRDTQAGIIAKDADYLEMAAMAKEYQEQGFAFAQDWLTNITAALKTESARRLMAELARVNSNDWWQGLKKLPPRD